LLLRKIYVLLQNIFKLLKTKRRRVMNVEELLKNYAAGERNFAGIDLSHATDWADTLRNLKYANPNLRGFDLRGINLKGANLCLAYLPGTNLTGADLTGANLLQANLIGANLTEAILTGANLREAKLGADLTRACLESANLTWATLRGANLFQANLTWAILIETNLGNATNWDMVLVDRTFLWKTILPDGTVQIDPIYKSYWDK